MDNGLLNLTVDVSDQMIYLRDVEGNTIKQYPVSTSQHGVGSRTGSYKTPLGQHRVYQKIGDHMPQDQVYVGRKALGRLPELEASGEKLPDDLIMARIIWLEGCEEGFNRGDDVDTLSRYIYIHGTREEEKIGTPSSIGCIRMRNLDIIELYEKIDVGCVVVITL